MKKTRFFVCSNKLKGRVKLRAHVNKYIIEKILLKIEKIVKIFLILDKFFSKFVYYCVPLGHTLVKSIN